MQKPLNLTSIFIMSHNMTEWVTLSLFLVDSENGYSVIKTLSCLNSPGVDGTQEEFRDMCSPDHHVTLTHNNMRL